MTTKMVCAAYLSHRNHYREHLTGSYCRRKTPTSGFLLHPPVKPKLPSFSRSLLYRIRLMSSCFVSPLEPNNNQPYTGTPSVLESRSKEEESDCHTVVAATVQFDRVLWQSQQSVLFLCWPQHSSNSRQPPAAPPSSPALNSFGD